MLNKFKKTENHKYDWLNASSERIEKIKDEKGYAWIVESDNVGENVEFKVDVREWIVSKLC